MSRAVLSLGANLDDPEGRLHDALTALAPWLCAVSGWYRTPPWGPVAQDDFLNLVAVVDDGPATPEDWLARARACERAADRRRGVRWGPRTLDVDVLTVREGPGGDDVVSGDPDLTLPHPRAAERAFVLVPWADVEPDAVVPGTAGRTVVQLRDALPATERAGVRPFTPGGSTP